MKKVKITAIRKIQHTDLSAQYENPIEHACDMHEGQTFISVDVDAQKPEGLCESAWGSMHKPLLWRWPMVARTSTTGG